jgi:CRP-like cAMP-binding protein
MEDLQAIIAQHPFFRGLDPRHLPLLVEGARRVRFAPGHVIAREGEEAHEFFVVLRGKVELEAYIAPQGQVGFQTIGEGEALGWSWLFPPFQWHFSARAVEETEAVAWDTARLRAQADVNPHFGYELACRMTQVLHQRLHATHMHLIDYYNPLQ